MKGDQITRTETLDKLEKTYDMLTMKIVKYQRGIGIARAMHFSQIKAATRRLEQVRFDIFNHLLDYCKCDSIDKFSNYYNGFFSLNSKYSWVPLVKISKRRIYKIFDQLKESNPTFKYYIDQSGKILKYIDH